MTEKKKYVIVGAGGRSSMYITALARDFKDVGELKAFCDTNQTRMDYWNGVLQKEYQHPAVPTYKADDFDRMIAEQKPDSVIVTSMDRTHHLYICRAMELGCDAISEKPMTTNEERCQQIIDTVRRTGRNLTVTFNYRYSPRNTKVKEVLRSGAVGEITSVHFEWLLDTSHGADYFRRWHRNKINSGGLMVHKSTHHFDLMNWWLDSSPETVFAMGGLRFYGKENAERRGVRDFYFRARGSEIAQKDPFALKVDPTDERVMGLYYNAEAEDHYFRDQSVFGDGIDIEDNMSIVVRYENKAVMTYSLCAHCPWEGYRVCFNGTRGRLEFNVVEKAFVDGRGEDFSEFGAREMDGDRKTMMPEIVFQPHWGKPRVIEYDQGDKSGHGGGDARLLADVFRGVKDDPFGHAAGYVDGARSILTGIAANKSMRTGLPVEVRSLVSL
ncbi:MAG: Gfo/Idh/MocA family oxidoreductase [Kiritimatiellia bacterium]|nr:Gfo/Idh/MocA family oxidoreductase [Kiritimatiellia bacterium]